VFHIVDTLLALNFIWLITDFLVLSRWERKMGEKGEREGAIILCHMLVNTFVVSCMQFLIAAIF
jgi:hypothetical protein